MIPGEGRASANDLRQKERGRHVSGVSLVEIG